MCDETKLLLYLIKENKSLNEISTSLGLSNKQIFTRLSMLRNGGYQLNRKYFYNGDIRYSFVNPLYGNDSKNEIFIEIPKNLDEIRVVLTSDNHFGNKKDSFLCADLVTEYCVQNGIHFNFNLGDFFEGIYPNASKYIKYNDPYQQIDYVLKNYPYDKSILMPIVLGNHDITFWLECGIDIRSILLDRRHDMIPVGYGYGIVNLGKFQIFMQHPIERCNLELPALNGNILLIGHSHKFKILSYGSSLVIHVPTASGVSVGSNSSLFPSMVDMTLKIKDGKIRFEYFQQFLLVNQQWVRVGEMQYKHIIKPNVDEYQNSDVDLQPQLSNIDISSVLSKMKRLHK